MTRSGICNITDTVLSPYYIDGEINTALVLSHSYQENEFNTNVFAVQLVEHWRINQEVIGLSPAIVILYLFDPKLITTCNTYKLTGD